MFILAWNYPQPYDPNFDLAATVFDLSNLTQTGKKVKQALIQP